MMKNLKFQLGLIAFLLFPMAMMSRAQEKEIEAVSFKAENWEFKPGTVEFLEYKSKPAMKLLPNGNPVVLKDFNFTNGTIEYDMEPLLEGFTSVYFRWKNSDESEIFYFRTWSAGNPQAMNATQYAPNVKGVNLWDMLFHFQANANYKNHEWNHVKLVVSGKQMKAYVNDMAAPVLEVPMLEGNTASGTLAFDGEVVISNLVVTHHEVEGLPPEPGIDPLANDPRYIRKWMVSEPVFTEAGIDIRNEYYPGDKTKWVDITAERRGLINLTRVFGKTDERRIIWLKASIHSDKEQEKMLRFGFSDEVWVYINDRPLYIDKNHYNTPMAKQPDGRCSIENTSFSVPLKEGENQMLIGLANYFYGWGMVARFDDLNGIMFKH